jgi:two-component system, NarL family, invasion response regulator UvrY
MIRVLITDDHPVVRRGLRQLLEDDRYDRFGLISEAANGNEMMKLIRKKDFDVILLDISLPGRGGLELLSDLRKIKPSVPVVILSIYPEEQYAIRSLKLGASAYLNKASAPDELIAAILKVSQGGRYISSSLAEKISFNSIEEKEKPLHDTLSVRELEVMLALSNGMTLSAIAKKFALSPKTISTYRQRILSKLDLKTTSDIIRYAFTEGLSAESK